MEKSNEKNRPLSLPIRRAIESSDFVAGNGGWYVERLLGDVQAFEEGAARQALAHCLVQLGLGKRLPEQLLEYLLAGLEGIVEGEDVERALWLRPRSGRPRSDRARKKQQGLAWAVGNAWLSGASLSSGGRNSAFAKAAAERAVALDTAREAWRQHGWHFLQLHSANPVSSARRRHKPLRPVGVKK